MATCQQWVVSESVQKVLMAIKMKICAKYVTVIVHNAMDLHIHNVLNAILGFIIWMVLAIVVQEDIIAKIWIEHVNNVLRSKYKF